MEKGGLMYIFFIMFCFHFMKCLEKGCLIFNSVMDLLCIFLCNEILYHGKRELNV